MWAAGMTLAVAVAAVFRAFGLACGYPGVNDAAGAAVYVAVVCLLVWSGGAGKG